MTITHDPELPWAVINTRSNRLAARFGDEQEAHAFVGTTYGGFVVENTTPVPTEAGVYAIKDAGVRNSRHFLLTTKGKWFWLDFTATEAKDVLEATTPDVVARYELTPKWVEA